MQDRTYPGEIEDQTQPHLLMQKVWLPKAVYDALPWFYFVAGIAAFFTTIYVNHWLWVVPHYVLFSAACLHISLMILRRRRLAKTERQREALDAD